MLLIMLVELPDQRFEGEVADAGDLRGALPVVVAQAVEPVD